ncbi:hypothetical protein ATO10_02490 [Actibacterium atlanticum]|uniref:Uncharacterized protein n=1 Tax=Actibacterium atlanticum TaxID=1461693 RepID=A0A058ZQZ3_9RHOB|nr:hypothetical protein [Actibacterium atlanticum]KCV83592.1 hypothetical protein ATO10_02490 [Actibacterium atlanticum]
MAEYVVQGFGWTWVGEGEDEVRTDFQTHEFTFEDSDGVFEYQVVPGETFDFSPIALTGLDGLSVDGTPLGSLPVDQATFGYVEWSGGTSYVLLFEDSSFADGRQDFIVIIGGAPFEPETLEEFYQFEQSITAFGGAPDNGPYAPNTPISLADLPGLGQAPVNLIEGGSKDDFLFGSQDADEINGNGGADTLLGRDGDDVLNGGAGRDIEIGGEGADTFVFGTGSELDIILDFDVTEDILQIDMDAPAARDDVAFVQSLANYTIVGIGGGDVAVLLGNYDRSDVVDSIEYL